MEQTCLWSEGRARNRHLCGTGEAQRVERGGERRERSFTEHGSDLRRMRKGLAGLFVRAVGKTTVVSEERAAQVLLCVPKKR